MARELVTRATLRRALVVNAMSKPVAVAVPSALVVAAILIDAWWLLPIALVVYLALAAATFFDGDEAERVGRRVYARAHAPAPLPRGLDPAIDELLARARSEELRVRAAIGASRLPLVDIAREVDRLMAEVGTIARRAQVVVDYLAAEPRGALERRLVALEHERGGTAAAEEARQRAVGALEAQLRLRATFTADVSRFRAEMEHLIASLAVVHGQLVQIAVANDAHLQEEIARQVRDLRGRVGAVAETLTDPVGRADDVA